MDNINTRINYIKTKSKKESIADDIFSVVKKHFPDDKELVIDLGEISKLSNSSLNYMTVVNALKHVVRHTLEDIHNNDLDKIIDIWILDFAAGVFKGGLTFSELQNIRINTSIGDREKDNSFVLKVSLVTKENTSILLTKNFTLSDIDALSHIVSYKTIELPVKLITEKTFYELINKFSQRLYSYLGASLNINREYLVDVSECKIKACDMGGMCVKCSSFCKMKREIENLEKKAEIQKTIEEKRLQEIKKQKELLEKHKGNFLYFLHDKALNRVKIGVSTSPEKRKRTIETSTGLPLTFYGLWANAGHMETPLHHKFAEYRTMGEWFEFSDEIKQYIEEECKNQIVIELENLEKV